MEGWFVTYNTNPNPNKDPFCKRNVCVKVKSQCSPQKCASTGEGQMSKVCGHFFVCVTPGFVQTNFWKLTQPPIGRVKATLVICSSLMKINMVIIYFTFHVFEITNKIFAKYTNCRYFTHADILHIYDFIVIGYVNFNCNYECLSVLCDCGTLFIFLSEREKNYCYMTMSGLPIIKKGIN